MRDNVSFAMPIEMVLKGRVPVKAWTDRIEPEATEHLKNIASLPACGKWPVSSGNPFVVWRSTAT